MVGLGTVSAFFFFVPLGWAAEASEDEAIGPEDEDEEDACIPPVLVESVAAVPLVLRIAAEDLGGFVSEDLGGDGFLAGCCFNLFGEGSLPVDGNRKNNAIRIKKRS